MNKDLSLLINKLENEHSLTISEYEFLIENRNEKTAQILAKKAVKLRNSVYGNEVFIRGLIEISNICKNDCLYCGIRCSNKDCNRYRLTKAQIMDCCKKGYSLGFRTFVMQGGEDEYFSDEIVSDIIREIKQKYPDCAVTLSLGEKSYDSYKMLFDAGADRYLLRHETADKLHYQRLHPNDMVFDRRIQCLYDLQKIGYQTGCGFMVGSPYQTSQNIAKDLKFIEQFRPAMCGIGPFIPHKATPFKDSTSGTLELTCYLLSIIRLILPNVLLPSTTALGTIDTNGHIKGILSGANVIMPNLSPQYVRNKYELYNNKYIGEESAECIADLSHHIQSIGYKIVIDRGDVKTY